MDGRVKPGHDEKRKRRRGNIAAPSLFTWEGSGGQNFTVTPP